MNNASQALLSGTLAIKSGETRISLGGLAEAGSASGSDSAAIAVLLAWQREALKLNQDLIFVDIPASLESFASLYGVDAMLGGFARVSVSGSEPLRAVPL